MTTTDPTPAVETDAWGALAESDPAAATGTPEALDDEASAQLVLATAFLLDRAKAMHLAARENLNRRLAEEYADTKSKSRDLFLGGRKVASATLPASKDATEVKSETTLREWLKEVHGDDAVQTIEVIRPEFLRAYLKSVVWTAYDPEDSPEPELSTDPFADVHERYPESRVEVRGKHMRATDPKSGEFVPGLTLKEGRVDVSQFRLVYEKPKAGEARTDDNQETGQELVAAWMESQPEPFEVAAEALTEAGLLALES